MGRFAGHRNIVCGDSRVRNERGKIVAVFGRVGKPVAEFEIDDVFFYWCGGRERAGWGFVDQAWLEGRRGSEGRGDEVKVRVEPLGVEQRLGDGAAGCKLWNEEKQSQLCVGSSDLIIHSSSAFKKRGNGE